MLLKTITIQTTRRIIHIDVLIKEETPVKIYITKKLPMINIIKLKNKYMSETKQHNIKWYMMSNNGYILINEQKIKKRKRENEYDNYIAATNIKYLINNDIQGYLLKKMNINTTDKLIKYICMTDAEKHNLLINRSYNINEQNKNEIQEYIYQQGFEFEEKIINYIHERSKTLKISFKKIMTDARPLKENYKQYITNTEIAINDKIEIIYQGMIASNSNIKYLGFPDLIISKKIFNKIFDNTILINNSNKITDDVNNNDNIYEYIIIDIKSSSILMNTDGKTVRNTELMKLYKLQLGVYGYIMNENYNKKIMTYILPNNVKGISKSKKNPYNITIHNPLNNNKLLVINIDTSNNNITQYYNYYENYLRIIQEANDKMINNELYIVPIKLLYDEQIQQLQSLHNIDEVKTCDTLLSLNTTNYDDTIYMPIINSKMDELNEIKLWILKQTRAIRVCRGFMTQDIEKLKENGIISYLQTNKIIEKIENGTIKVRDTNIIKNIIKANSVGEQPIYCENKKQKLEQIKNIFRNKKIIICLDFETIPHSLTHGDNNIYDEDEKGQKVFMIGCMTYKIQINNNKLHYNEINDNEIKQQYTLNNITDESIILFEQLKNNIQKIKIKYNMLDDEICYVIWSSFEKTVIYNSNYNHIINNNKIFNIDVIDLMQVMTTNNGIGVRNAFNYSIKSIAYGLKEINGFIPTNNIYWNSEIMNGYNAMFYALWYYNNKTDDKHMNRFENIKEYNLIDCKIMIDILEKLFFLLK